MSDGEWPTSASCTIKGLIIVTSRSCESGSTTWCVTAVPVGFQAGSGTAPVSQINVPFGCVTRKHATDRSLVATSSFLSWKRSKSAMSRVPQSNTYSLTDGGGGGARRSGEGAVCPASQVTAKNTSPATRFATTDRDVLCSMFQPSFLALRAHVSKDSTSNPSPSPLVSCFCTSNAYGAAARM